MAPEVGNTGINRLIIIGNGFDLHHGLKTRYSDFMENFWMTTPYNQDNPLVRFNFFANLAQIVGTAASYFELQSRINDFYKNNHDVDTERFISFKNDFFEQLCQQSSDSNWVDFEMNYFAYLCSIINTHKDYRNRSFLVERLNLELVSILDCFEKYLKREVQPKINDSLRNKLVGDTIFANKELQIGSQQYEQFVDEFSKRSQRRFPLADLDLHLRSLGTNYDKLLAFNKTLVLNFNYTHTPLIYKSWCSDMDTIFIHGELGDPNNPLTLGYGDENHPDVKRMEEQHENEMMRMAKSSKYLLNRNYKQLMNFLALGPFQLHLVGHSCAISDRTLLSSIFQDPNCFSIKPYYFNWQRNSFNDIDNYADLIANVSRHFTDKLMMREKVVNKEYCTTFNGTK